MKKIIALSILLCICLSFIYGCTNGNTPIAIGKKIDKNLNNLYNTVNNLDTIDNSYIANTDIYQLEDVNQTNIIKKSFAVPEQKQVEKIDVNEVTIKTEDEEVTFETENNKLNESNFLNNNDEQNEEDDDLTITNSTEDKVNNTENDVEDDPNVNVYTEIKNEVDSTDLKNNNNDINIKEDNDNKRDTLQEPSVDIIFEKDISDDTNLNDTLIIDENGDGRLIDENGNEIKENKEIPQEKLDQIFEDTVNDNTLSSDEKEKVYIFLFDKIRYVPRYARNINTDLAQNTLNNYLYKVQELYTMTADVVEANNILAEEKEELLNRINNLKIINNKMIDGEIVPNNQQLIALNNYAQDIKTTIKRIKACNGQLNNEINNISTTSSNYGISKGVDIINSNYLKILNHIDARITYFKSALATLDQVNYILKEAQLQITYNIDDNYDNSQEVVQENTTKSNIDTYKNTNNNLDSYSSNKTEDKGIDINDDVNDNNIQINDNNLDKNVNNPTQNNIVDNNNINQNVPNNNQVINNIPLNGEDVNAPNGTFQNGIITQNNLNNGTNNGVNGNLSGYANGEGYIDYYKQNNFQRTDKNINTYGKNSLVDMINNGTVNNGINTLSITNDSLNKPIMVDNEINTNIEEFKDYNDINSVLDTDNQNIENISSNSNPDDEANNIYNNIETKNDNDKCSIVTSINQEDYFNTELESNDLNNDYEISLMPLEEKIA